MASRNLPLLHKYVFHNDDDLQLKMTKLQYRLCVKEVSNVILGKQAGLDLSDIEPSIEPDFTMATTVEAHPPRMEDFPTSPTDEGLSSPESEDYPQPAQNPDYLYNDSGILLDESVSMNNTQGGDTNGHLGDDLSDTSSTSDPNDYHISRHDDDFHHHDDRFTCSYDSQGNHGNTDQDDSAIHLNGETMEVTEETIEATEKPKTQAQISFDNFPPSTVADYTAGEVDATSQQQPQQEEAAQQQPQQEEGAQQQPQQEEGAQQQPQQGEGAQQQPQQEEAAQQQAAQSDFTASQVTVDSDDLSPVQEYQPEAEDEGLEEVTEEVIMRSEAKRDNLEISFEEEREDFVPGGGAACDDVETALRILKTRYRLSCSTLKKCIITSRDAKRKRYSAPVFSYDRSRWNIQDMIRQPNEQMPWWSETREPESITFDKDNMGTMNDDIEKKQDEIADLLQKVLEEEERKRLEEAEKNGDATAVVEPPVVASAGEPALEAIPETQPEAAPTETGDTEEPTKKKKGNVFQRMIRALRKRLSRNRHRA